jgi:hypothetical protein
MEVFSVKRENPGGPVTITRGLAVTEGGRIVLGSTDGAALGSEPHIPLSDALSGALGGRGLVENASVMRSPTSLKLLAKENVEKDRAGAVLVLVSVAPPEGHATVLTRAELAISRCHSRGTTDTKARTCDECGIAYAEECSGTFRHPQSGMRSFYNEHLPYQIVEVGEGPHVTAGRQTHKDLLAIMEPGARLRIAAVKNDGRVVEERVLVRTDTELGFAAAGGFYLASELAEAHAEYI